MNEEFLQFIWEHGLFNQTDLKTVDGKSVEVILTGHPNTDSGPDFLMPGFGLEKPFGLETSKFIRNHHIGINIGTTWMLLTTVSFCMLLNVTTNLFK